MPSDRVLDVGCGDGSVARALAPLCRQWIGCDFSEHMVKEACGQRIPNASFVVAIAGNMPFQRRMFDKALVNSSLHYLTPDRAKQAVEGAKRLCRPSSRILLGDLPDRDRKRAYETETGFGMYRKALSFGSGVLRYLTRRPRLVETWFSRAWVSAVLGDEQYAVRILDRDSPHRFDALLLPR